jgi:hypothetical protein
MTNVYIGRNIMRYWNALCAVKCPDFYEKAMLLMRSAHEGHWSPGKRARNRFYRQYGDVMSPGVACALFESCSNFQAGYYFGHYLARNALGDLIITTIPPNEEKKPEGKSEEKKPEAP